MECMLNWPKEAFYVYFTWIPPVIFVFLKYSYDHQSSIMACCYPLDMDDMK